MWIITQCVQHKRLIVQKTLWIFMILRGHENNSLKLWLLFASSEQTDMMHEWKNSFHQCTYTKARVRVRMRCSYNEECNEEAIL